MVLLTTCPMGHEENLSHAEMARRLEEGDFECREDGCSKNVEYPVGERFWEKHVTGRDRRPFIRSF